MNNCSPKITELTDYYSFKNTHNRIETIYKYEPTKVTLFQDKITGKHYAVKRLPLGDPADKEFRISQLFCHANFMTTYQKFDRPEKSKTYIVMEHVEGDVMTNMRLISVSDSKTSLKQLLIAPIHCLNKEIIPFDLHPGNVMISPKNHIKFIDFGKYIIFNECEDPNKIYQAMHTQIENLIYLLSAWTIQDNEQEILSESWFATFKEKAPEMSDIRALKDWYIKHFEHHLEHSFLSQD